MEPVIWVLVGVVGVLLLVFLFRSARPPQRCSTAPGLGLAAPAVLTLEPGLNRGYANGNVPSAGVHGRLVAREPRHVSV